MAARRAPLLQAAAAAGCLLLAIVAATVGASVGGPGAAVLLAALHAAGLGVWAWQGSRLGRGWATASAVTGAAWALLFFVPCAVYAVAPRYLPGLNVVGAIAVVDVSLFAMLAGYVIGIGRRTPQARTATLDLRAATVRPLRAAGWFVVGLLGLAALMANAGGPRAYLSNLGGTAGLNAGLFYVVWVALALRFSPTAVALLRWSAGRPLGRMALAGLVAGLGLLLLTGARSFVAVGLVQLLLTYALVRRRPSLRRLGPVALIGGLLLVFGVGAVKRHQTYDIQHPDAPISLGSYLVDVAPSETVDAYVNNYVDTVRLVAMARAVVPGMAPYEGVRPLEALLLKPVPSTVRPVLRRNAEIKRVFEPAGAYAYAEPLQVTAFLAGGPLAVALAFLIVGLGIARLDRWLAAGGVRSPAAAAAAVAACVQVPILLRSGLPNGAAFFGVEVAGTAAVTWHVAGGAVLGRRGATAWPLRLGRGSPRPRLRALVPWLPLALPIVALLVAAGAGMWAMGDNPALGQDSAGFLADARVLAGAGVTPHEQGSSYPFAYALLLSPAYLVTTGIVAVYRWGVAANLVCVLLAGWGARAIAREWFALDRVRAGVVAAATILLPVLALNASVVWATCAVIAAFTWWSVWLVRATREPTRRSLLCTAALAVATYATHHATAPVLAVTLIAFVALGRRHRRRAIEAVALLVALLAAASLVDAHVHGTISLAGENDLTISRVLELRPAELGAALSRLLGQAWAMTAGSLGLAAAGAWALARRRTDRLPSLLILLAGLGTMAIAASFFTTVQIHTSLLRVDGLAYERYAAPFATVLAAAGLAALLSGRVRPWIGPLAAVVLGATFVAVMGAHVDGAVAVLNIPGVAALGSLTRDTGTLPDGLAFGTIALTAAAGAAAVAAAATWRRSAAAAVVLLGFGLLTLSGAREIGAYNRFWDGVATTAPQILSGVPLGYPVGYDLAALSGDYLNRFQMLEPRRRWILFDSRAGDPPPSGLVVAGADWAGAARAEAAPIAAEANPQQVLWRVGNVRGGGMPAPSWRVLLGRHDAPAG